MHLGLYYQSSCHHLATSHLAQCLSLVTLCFCSQVLPPACVCIFIYAVDGNNLLENVYFMTRSVTLLDMIRGLKN